MGGNSLFSYATLFGFLFALARVSGIFAFLPLAVFRAAPESARIVLSVAMTLMLRGEWKTPVGAEASVGRIVAGLAGESALGSGDRRFARNRDRGFQDGGASGELAGRTGVRVYG